LSESRYPLEPRVDWHTAPVTNVSQLGGIETSVLDNGPGRGVRIAWVNTGGGLRYKVVIDRGLDIADAEYLGQSLTWHSFGGVTAPTAAYEHGFDWLRSFHGGLLVGCGPLHTGAPFTEGGQEFGLHGTHSNTPAAVESIVNPDLPGGKGEMRISGTVRTARVFDPNVELHRTIASTLGVPAIRVVDRLTNRGNTTVPLEWLLHMNFGYPLLEPEASVLCWRGKATPLAGSEQWYSEGHDYKTVPSPIDEHRGTGEACAYIDPDADPEGNVVAGVVNRKRGFGLKIEFSLREFSRIVNWQHWGPDGSFVAAIEPANGGVESRPLDAERGWLQHLAPGESRTFHCRITASSDDSVLQTLLDLNR
jgi:Domain of unknown function (DUF4432)